MENLTQKNFLDNLQAVSAPVFEKNFKKKILQQKWAKLVLPVAIVSDEANNYFQSSV